MAGEDFYISVGTNLSVVMGQLQQAIGRATILDTMIDKTLAKGGLAAGGIHATGGGSRPVAPPQPKGLLDRTGMPFDSKVVGPKGLKFDSSAMAPLIFQMGEMTRAVRALTAVIAFDAPAVARLNRGIDKTATQAGKIQPAGAPGGGGGGALSAQALEKQNMKIAAKAERDALATEKKNFRQSVQQQRGSAVLADKDKAAFRKLTGQAITGVGTADINAVAGGRGTVLGQQAPTGFAMGQRTRMVRLNPLDMSDRSGLGGQASMSSLMRNQADADRFEKQFMAARTMPSVKSDRLVSDIQSRQVGMLTPAQTNVREYKIAAAAKKLETKATEKLAKEETALAKAVRKRRALMGKRQAAIESGSIQTRMVRLPSGGQMQVVDRGANTVSQKTGRILQRGAPMAPEIEKATKAQKGFNKAVAAADSPLKSTFRRALLYGTVTTAIFGTIAAAAAFVGVMIKMDTQMAQLRKKLAGTDEDFRRLTDSAVQIARRYKAGTQDVLDAIELFSGKFKSAADLSVLAEQAVLFSNISGQGLAQSAEALTATLTQYNLSVSESVQVTDSWAAVAAQTAVSVKDLGDAVGVVGIAAKTAGLDLDELNGIVAAVAAGTGQSGKQIGNALKRIFERSSAPRNVKTLQKLDILPLDAKGEARPFLDVLAEVRKKWDGFSDSQKKTTAVAFAGARQFNSFLAIMNNYDEALRLTSVSQNSLGDAQRQNDRIAETFLKKVQALGVEFDQLARTLSGPFLGALGGIVDGIRMAIKAFNDLGTTADGEISGIGRLLQGLAVGGAGALALEFGIGGLVGAARGTKAGGGSGGLSGAAAGAITGGKGGRFSLAGKVGAGVSAVGGSVGVTSGGIAAFLAGLAAIGAVIATVTGAFLLFKTAMEDATDQSDELRATDAERVAKVKQDIRIATNLSASFTKLSGDLGEAKTNEQQDDIRKNASGFIKDFLANEKDLNLDQDPLKLLRSLGITFNRAGEAVNVTSSNLEVLSEKLREAADATERKSLIDSGASARAETSQVLEGLKGLRISEKGVIKGQGPNTPGVNAAALIRQLERALPSVGFTIGGETELTRKQAAKIQKLPGFELGSAISGKEGGALSIENIQTIAKALSAMEQTQTKLQSAFDPRLLKLKGQKGKGGEDLEQAEVDKQNDAIYKSIASDLIRILGNMLPKDLIKDFARRGFIETTPDPRGKDVSVGVRTSDPGESRKFRASVSRIDLEFQKGLADNAVLFQTLGGQQDFLAGAIGVYRKAINDLAVNTKKAAGPLEENAKVSRMISQAEAKAAEREGKKEVKIAGEMRSVKAILDAQDKQKYALQQINKERKIALELVKELRKLEAAKIMTESIRGPLASSLSALGANNQSRLEGGRQLHADKNFVHQKIAREQEVQRREGIVDTPQGRNRLKHLKEELEAIDRQMDDLNEKTGFFNNLLDKIGNQAIGKIFDKVVTNLVNNLGADLAGGPEGKSGKAANLFGAANPKENVLATAMAANTAALYGNTAALGGNVGTALLGDTGETLPFGASPSIKKGGRRQLSIGGGKVQELETPDQAKGGGLTKEQVGSAIGAAIVGAGIGGQITKSQGKEGRGGQVGGAVGAAIGSTTPLGPVGGLIGGVLGGAIGSLFDKPTKPLIKKLDELEDEARVLSQTMAKNTNTINDLMETIINAPSDFVVPIPKGILENSITAQSAIAVPMQAGGFVRRSGPAFLHAGETVTSANDINRGSNGGGGGGIGGVSFTINGGDSSPKEIADQVMSQLNRVYKNQGQQGGNAFSRF